MANWKLCVILLLPLCVATEDSEVTLVKTIGSEPDVTPLCTNSTLDIVTLIVCKIRTQRNRTEECRLLYQYGHDFVHECDSRFKLMMENQTFYLHLTSLTPVDSGNYTCECSRQNGTSILHLNITVEDHEETSISTLKLQEPFLVVSTSVTVVVIITAVILVLIYRIKCNGGCSKSATSGPSVCGSLAEDDPDDPYTSLQRPSSDLYQTIWTPASNLPLVHLDKEETDGESEQSFNMYENESIQRDCNM